MKPVTFKPERARRSVHPGDLPDHQGRRHRVAPHQARRHPAGHSCCASSWRSRPTSMVPPLPEPKPGQTTRERVSVHSEAACATCHKLIDPVGLRLRELRRHRHATAPPRRASRSTPAASFPLGGATLNFKNAVEMLPQLAKSQEARDCMVTQWWRYALRRQELASEEPSLKLVREAFKQSGYDMRELLVAFTRTRAFSHRTAVPRGGAAMKSNGDTSTRRTTCERSRPPSRDQLEPRPPGSAEGSGRRRGLLAAAAGAAGPRPGRPRKRFV